MTTQRGYVMRITGLGHAGLWIETDNATVLCDPWLNPAFFGSWFPHPDNRGLDWSRFSRPDYMYISHRHADHLDARLLRDLVDKRTTILVPDYPTADLERSLTDIGFTNLRRMPANTTVQLDGLSAMISPMRSPSDGPIGDSSLSLSDGRNTILNQNDAHLLNLDVIREFGPYGIHFMQHSGAIWWPMCYDMSPRAMRSFAALKRQSQRKRAIFYAKAIDATSVVPFAGPPAFLDEPLQRLNGTGPDGESIFESQEVFLEQLSESGVDQQGIRFVAGTEITLENNSVAAVRQTLFDEEQIDWIYRNPQEYIEVQATDRREEIEEARVPPPGDVDGEFYLQTLKNWFEPLMASAPIISSALAGGVALDLGIVDVMLDFRRSEVRHREPADKPRYWFQIEPALVYSNIQAAEPDWCNTIFLSFRFKTGRVGKFNQQLYAFFTSLSQERMDYIERWYAEKASAREMIDIGDWTVQRNCPHLGADFSTSGIIEGEQLVCQVHGWRFDLATGACLTTAGERITTSRREPRA
ncbi:Rieske 2Fe-2S domain-containing protein [Curtobacterium sp. RRHDQ66]|uniref:Rieske 2Fe-2S domain-containing protein n=1 Tax=Curtobacterium guangdongense TaxID=3413380 RepID=UPI003BF06FFD